MNLRNRLFAVFLWWSVIGVGTWIGGTLYMMLVIDPIWSASPPQSVEAFLGGTSFIDHIGNFFGPLWMLARYPPVLIALILGWKYTRHRYYLLVATATFVFVVVFTNAYIYPINTILMTPHVTIGQPAEEVQRLVDQWMFADRVRFAIGSIGYLCLLKAFRLPLA